MLFGSLVVAVSLLQCNIDFSQWAIQFPDNNNFYERKSSNPLVSHKDHKGWLTWDSNDCPTFKAPNMADYGQATKNSNYLRTELREVLDGPGSQRGIRRNWVTSKAKRDLRRKAARVDGIMKATLQINRVSETGKSGYKIGRVVVGQLHGETAHTPCRLYYRKLPDHTKGSVYFAVEKRTSSKKKETKYYTLVGFKSTSGKEPRDGIPLNAKWRYEIDLKGRYLTVTMWNHEGKKFKKKTKISNGYKHDWMYFKAGVYNGNNEGKKSDYVEAKFYELTHGERGASSTPQPPPTPVPAYRTPQPPTAYECNIDLTEWGITFPNGKNFYEQNDKNPLATTEDYRNYLTWDAGECPTFRTPNVGGKSTPNSNYLRSELRELLDGDGGARDLSRNWVTSRAPKSMRKKAARVDGNMKAMLQVNHVSTTIDKSQKKMGRVMVGQIHGSVTEPCRLYYRKLPKHERASVYFAVETPSPKKTTFYSLIGFTSETGSEPSDGIPLFARWRYEIDFFGDILTVTVWNHKGKKFEKAVKVQGYDNDWMYFKAGVYNGNNEGKKSDYVEAKFYELTHGERSKTNTSP
eukprot:TRINITY_DN822_c0_g2_i1.p1 TRINITY_DN822_c0_g2~~TRINITY_DN822_c0_g2_i1.p1  ORF type:complete len:576 (+),score=119.20 TRINITY_DN822_c0_g2_i1:66-1793(+)